MQIRKHERIWVKELEYAPFELKTLRATVSAKRSFECGTHYLCQAHRGIYLVLRSQYNELLNV